MFVDGWFGGGQVGSGAPLEWWESGGRVGTGKMLVTIGKTRL